MHDENSAPLNIRKGLKEFDNNIEFYKDLIDEFLEHVERRISVMDKAITDKDTRVLKDEAHAIKGGAANLNANGLSKAAYEFEDSVIADGLSNSSEGIKVIKKEFCRLKEYLTNHDSLQ